MVAPSSPTPLAVLGMTGPEPPPPYPPPPPQAPRSERERKTPHLLRDVLRGLKSAGNAGLGIGQSPVLEGQHCRRISTRAGHRAVDGESCSPFHFWAPAAVAV